jgi:hypothetical protein
MLDRPADLMVAGAGIAGRGRTGKRRIDRSWGRMAQARPCQMGRKAAQRRRFMRVASRSLRWQLSNAPWCPRAAPPGTPGRAPPPDSSASVAITPVAELLDKSWVGRRPIELGSSIGRDGPLIEQQDFGKVLA